MVRSLLLLSLVLTPMAACKKKAPPAAPEPTVTRDTQPTVPEAPAREVPVSVQNMRQNFERVYFDLDKHTLSPEAQQALQDNVEIMQAETDITIEVQGHADERGTTDYNLALGQKRAEAVKNYMVRSGIAETRVKSVSFGEERPAVDASNEQAWSKNRRAEFRIMWGDGASGTVK